METVTPLTDNETVELAKAALEFVREGEGLQPMRRYRMETVTPLTDTETVELAKAAATLEAPPYLWPEEAAPTRLSLAIEFVRTGAVTPDVGDDLTVRGKTASYLVSGGQCSCPASTKGKSKWCKHLVATELYTRWQNRIPPPTTRSSPMASTTAWTTLDGQPTEPPPDIYGPEDDDPDMSLPVPVPVRQTAVALPEALTDPPLCPHRSLAAIMADLSRPLPPACVAVREQKGQKIRYLHWWVVADILDAYAPGWEGAIVRHEELESCTMTYRLTIPTATGPVSREASGREDGKDIPYGDRSSNAEAMAFCRAAAKFGVRWLYTERDDTAKAFAAHLHTQKVEALTALAERCSGRGLEKQAVITTLRTRAGVSRNADLPLGLIQGCLE